MKGICTLFLFIICCIAAYAQKYEPELLVPYRDKMSWGYADTSGKIRIRPVYDSAAFFQYGPMAKVFLKGKECYIDTAGIAITPWFDHVKVSKNFSFIVQEQNKSGIVYRNKIAVKTEYDNFIAPENFPPYKEVFGEFIGVKNNEYYAVNFITGTVIKTGYQKITSPDNIPVTVQAPAYDSDKSVEIPVSNPGNQLLFKKDAAFVADSIKKAMGFEAVVPYLLNAYGKDGKFYSHYFKLYQNGKTGLLYKNHFIKPAYDSIAAIYEEYIIQIIAKKNGAWGLMNEREEVKIPFIYSGIRLESDEVFITSCKGKMGAIILRLGNPINTIACNFDYIRLARNLLTDYARFKVFYVKHKKSFGFTGQNGVQYFND